MRKVLPLILLNTVAWVLGCTTEIRTTGTYDDTYRTARDAVLGADFGIEKWASGTVGESPSTGRIDFYSVEEKVKFEPRRFVTLTIEPYGDTEVKERVLTLHGWRYGIVSVLTAGAWKVDQHDIERRAADAIRGVLASRDAATQRVPSTP